MENLALVLTLLIMLVGLIGSVAPALPGSPLIMLAALGYGWYTDFAEVTLSTLMILLVLMVMTLLVDYVAGLVGAKKYGASKWGLAGAFIGGLVGMVFGLPGLLAGPLAGAFIAEVLHGKSPREALLVGWGSLLGILGGGIVKGIIALAMVIVFLAALF